MCSVAVIVAAKHVIVARNHVIVAVNHVKDAMCRVVVIVASVVVFRNPMSLQTALCTLVALSGVFAYSQVKRLKAAAKAATA